MPQAILLAGRPLGSWGGSRNGSSGGVGSVSSDSGAPAQVPDSREEIVAEKGTNAWFEMSVEELLPEETRLPCS